MNATPPTIVLIGLRGSGKSTLGPRLAERLGVRFVDLDERTAALLGSATPGEALRAHSIDRFRSAESEALRATLDEGVGVLALGGGTPTAPGAADLLRDRARQGHVQMLYLHATPSLLAHRITASGAPERPSLTGADPAAEVGTLYAQRDPLYRELAQGVLHTDGVSEDAALAMAAAWARPD